MKKTDEVTELEEKVAQLTKKSDDLWNELERIKNSKGYRLLDKVYNNKFYQFVIRERAKRKKRRQEIPKYKKYQKTFHMTAKEIYEDFEKCKELYQANFEDYEVLKLYELNDEERKKYVTDGWMNDFIAKYNNKESLDIFENKEKFNRKFKKFIGRNFLSTANLTKEKFLKFIEGKEKIVYKPLNLSKGKGFCVFSLKNQDIDELYSEITQKDVGLIEDFIIQHPYMNKISKSVNTIRFTTFHYRGKLHFISAVLRLGVNSKADNWSAGGIAVNVNIKTGRPDDIGMDRKGNTYTVHPKSNIKLKDIKIPYWPEVIKLIEKCYNIVPDITYVGWDIAITEKGPILVEGNAHWPSWYIIQVTSQKGLKPKLEKIIGKKEK